MSGQDGDDLVIAGIVRRRMGPLRWRPYELILDTTGGLVTITLTPRDKGIVRDTRKKAERISGKLAGKLTGKRKTKPRDGARIFRAEDIISATLGRPEPTRTAETAVVAVAAAVHSEKHAEFVLKVEMNGANADNFSDGGPGGRDSLCSAYTEGGTSVVEREYRFRVATDSAAEGWVKVRVLVDRYW
jgi:hypothetical protein